MLANTPQKVTGEEMRSVSRILSLIRIHTELFVNQNRRGLQEQGQFGEARDARARERSERGRSARYVAVCARRGSQGVGLFLSPVARKAWEAAGAKVLYFDDRIITVRLMFLDVKGQRLSMLLASMYARVSSAS